MPLHILTTDDQPRAYCGLALVVEDGQLVWPEGHGTLVETEGWDDDHVDRVIEFNQSEHPETVCQECVRHWRGEPPAVGSQWRHRDDDTLVVVQHVEAVDDVTVMVAWLPLGSAEGADRCELGEFYQLYEPHQGASAIGPITFDLSTPPDCWISIPGRVEGLFAFINETRAEQERLQHELNHAYQQISKLSAIIAHLTLSKVNADPDHLCEDTKATIRRYLKTIRHGDAVEIHIEPRGEVGVMIDLRATSEPTPGDPQNLWERIDVED